MEPILKNRAEISVTISGEKIVAHYSIAGFAATVLASLTVPSTSHSARVSVGDPYGDC
jgi:hypothetical protein